jgi:hypothetical protein
MWIESKEEDRKITKTWNWMVGWSGADVYKMIDIE